MITSIKKTLSLVALIFLIGNVSAQFKHPLKTNEAKIKIHKKSLQLPDTYQLNPSTSQPSISYKPNGVLSVPSAKFQRTQIVKDGNAPILLKAHIPASRGNFTNRAYEFLDFVKKDMKIENPKNSFSVKSQSVDKRGGKHIRMSQVINDIPIYGKEIAIHELGQNDISLTGRFIQNPSIPATRVKLAESDALEFAKQQISKLTILKPINKNFRAQIGMPEQIIEKVYYELNDELYLVYHISMFPNITERWECFVDVTNGEVIKAYKNSCSFAASHTHSCASHKKTTIGKLPESNNSPSFSPDGDETTNATDLNGITRKIHTFKQGSTNFLIDASLDMYKSSQSTMPDEPIGVLWTIDGQNGNPNDANFGAAHITSGNDNWDPSGVSAHYNAKEAFNYFKNTHNRNSINGQGGNVISLINITDENNNQMDNAFWNGYAMFYGNGNQAFDKLQKSLDVGGHEMSHGVIQNTANLDYISQSGAMNESFADIFGTMIDRNDWQLGESIVNTNIYPSGALRDMSNPHNGGGPNDYYWQPKNMSEYKTLPETPQGDNGGVHLNSGILNYAYYLVATNIGKNNAEDIYYHALKNYLVRSSQFIDLRVALVESAKQLFGAGSTELAAIESSFNTVGIGSGTSGGGNTGGGGNHQTDINENNGNQHILSVGTDQSFIYVSQTNGQNSIKISDFQTKSNPSITDDGKYIVYVAADKTIQLITIDWSTGNISEQALQDQPIWRNVIISKDGNRIAALTDQTENIISVYDFGLEGWHDFELYNPTYTQGVSTGDVKYADAMEFDLSGEFIIYDAFNELKSAFGNSLDYWDIGFLKVYDNGSSNWGDGNVSKLFSGLPENTSVGNPSFSKNSPYIVTFDFIDDNGNYLLMTNNTQTGKSSDPAIFINGVINYPNFSTDDTQIIFNAQDNNGNDVLAQVDITADKLQPVENTAVVLLPSQQWGRWFADGERNLQVNTDDFANIDKFVISPNPTSNFVNIDIDVVKNLTGNLTIYNLQGQKLTSKWIDTKKGLNQYSFDLTKYTSGSYMIVLQFDNTRITKTIVKM